MGSRIKDFFRLMGALIYGLIAVGLLILSAADWFAYEPMVGPRWAVACCMGQAIVGLSLIVAGTLYLISLESTEGK